MTPATSGTLYLIPTPLGECTLSQILPEEVRRIAQSLEYFIAERPKTARQFLKQIGTRKPLQEINMGVLDEHTQPGQLSALLAPLLAGQDAGLVSEAGCPAVADPGANLVRLAHQQGIRVAPLVGPSSILLGLMGSGLNGQSFAFHGYLPADRPGRVRRIAELEKESARLNRTQIFIETPYRNQALFEDLLATCNPATLLCLAIDMTLPSETIATRSVAAWRHHPPALEKRPALFLLLAPGAR